MTRTAPYRLQEPGTPAMGLVVLRVDETIELEMRRDIPVDEARLYVTRVASGDDLTPDSIAEMERHLTAAACLLPPAAGFDVIGYACTSGTALIGADRVAALIREGVATRAVTNPLTAAVANLRALGRSRIAVLSPYLPSVSDPLCTAFEAEGVQVVDNLSFGEEVEARVARIDPASIASAARRLAAGSQPDALFLSCTNLRTCTVLPRLEAELGLPVLSSNRCLAWHMRSLVAE